MEAATLVWSTRQLAHNIPTRLQSKSVAAQGGALESHTVENYLKAIYQISQESQSAAAATGEVARRLEVTPGTVTAMMQRLAESGYVKYKSHQGARLTPTGNQLALRVLRRHRLVELFLAQTLGLSWDEIHAEAENLEHAVSDHLVDRIDQFLGYPNRDPHGDPIPDANGALRASAGDPLVRCQRGTRFVLERVLDQSPDFLRFLSQNGLEVGAEAVVVDNHPSAGVMTIAAGDQQASLGRDVAGRILVRTIDS